MTDCDCDCAVEFVSGASATPLAFVIEISAEMFGERTHRERGGRVGGRRKEEKNRQQAASRSATGGKLSWRFDGDASPVGERPRLIRLDSAQGARAGP